MIKMGSGEASMTMEEGEAVKVALLEMEGAAENVAMVLILGH